MSRFRFDEHVVTIRQGTTTSRLLMFYGYFRRLSQRAALRRR